MREPADQYPVLTVTGLRQSGKTTLYRALFPDYGYFNLDLIRQSVSPSPASSINASAEPIAQQYRLSAP